MRGHNIVLGFGIITIRFAAKFYARAIVSVFFQNQLPNFDFWHTEMGHKGKRNVKKEWLETVCFILDSHAVPLPHSAQEVTQRVNELREEKIDDQDTIIRLL